MKPTTKLTLFKCQLLFAFYEAERERLTVLLHRGATGEWDWDLLGNFDFDELVQWGFDAEELIGRDVGILTGVETYEPDAELAMKLASGEMLRHVAQAETPT